MPPHRQRLPHLSATARARLAGVGGFDRSHSLPGSCRLESKDAQESAPSTITDALGEMVILEQVADPQVFVIDRIVVAQELKCGLVMEILALALALHRLVRPGEQLDRLTPAGAAFPAPSDPSLAAPQVRLRLPVAARIMDHRAVRQGGK
jgi:hypothetical protein